MVSVSYFPNMAIKFSDTMEKKVTSFYIWVSIATIFKFYYHMPHLIFFSILKIKSFDDISTSPSQYYYTECSRRKGQYSGRSYYWCSTNTCMADIACWWLVPISLKACAISTPKGQCYASRILLCYTLIANCFH
jgi:hypothetical protein